MSRPCDRCCLASCLVSVLLFAPHALATTNIASWQGLRGAQIQTKLVLEGGIMSNGTFSNGQFQNGAIVQHSYGVYYQIDLSQSFDAINNNTDDYLIPGLPETSNTQAPNYIDGGLFHNDYQFYTFGYVSSTDLDNVANKYSGIADRPPIDSSTVLLGNVFPADPSVSRFDQGVSPNQQTDGVSDNITSGAYASSPDQGLGFYFSGMVSATRGQLEYNTDDNADNHPTITSNTFIKIDMTTANDAKFQYLTWPANFVPRAEGALVWLPYGKQGVLVAIGGVEVPGDLFLFPPRDTKDGPFMTELAIYDIDADAWHIQQTLETDEKPTQLASFCTAVVPTQDGNSHEIFVYGGYDGTYTSVDPNVRDDIWVLSVPSFQWTKVKQADSDSTHGRQGSVCFSPNPSTMITIGGTGQLGASLTSDTIIDVLDLNTLEWTGKYNASSDTNFSLPDVIVKQLNYPSVAGPGENAQVTGLNSTLNDLFSTRYSGEVKTYYPYGSNSTGGGEQPQKHSKNTWKVPLIAVLCTVIPILIIVVLLLFCLRRHRRSKQGVDRTQQSRKNVFSWLGKSPQIDPEAEKSHTSGDTAVESNPEYYNKKAVEGEVYEAPSTVPHEIMDNPQQRESISVRNHPYYPRSISGDHILSAATNGSPSRFSEGLSPSSHNPGVMSPFELAHEKSSEHLPAPSNNTKLNQPEMTHNAAHDTITTGTISTASDKGHHRNQSSMGSNMPSLPSPSPLDDVRMSKQINALPEIPASPLSPQKEPGSKAVSEHRIE